MALQFFENPFHATHDDEVASKMALKMHLSMFITDTLKTLNLKQSEAAARLGVAQSRISELATGKIENFTIDAMMDMLDKLGFRSTFTLTSSDTGGTPGIVISRAQSCE